MLLKIKNYHFFDRDNFLKSLFERFYILIKLMCTQNSGLKIQRWQHRAGSTPAAGIMIKTRFFKPCLFCLKKYNFLKITNNFFLKLSQWTTI